MDFNEYAEKFCNIKIDNDTSYDDRFKVKDHIAEKLSIILKDKYDKGELIFSDNLSGHDFFISLQNIIDKEANEKDFQQIADMLMVDVMSQSISYDNLMKIFQESGKKSNINFDKIDIDDLFNGNFQWKTGTMFNPDFSVFECHNDGKKYLMVMNDWKIDFINRQDFVRKKEVVYMQPFGFNNTPVETQIEFKTNELAVFNFLPKEISDFIDGHFNKKTFEYKGRDWQKNLNETYSCFNIHRTQTYCGGTVFQDNNYVILGRFDDEQGEPPEIGTTNSDVWQTLIAEKEDVIKLVMLALDKNREDAEDYFKTDFIEKQNGVLLTVEPGKYYSYTVPNMVSDNYENVYKGVKMQDVQSIDIDMLISKNKIKTTKELDTIKVVPEIEIENAKQVFNDFNEIPLLKM